VPLLLLSRMTTTRESGLAVEGTRNGAVCCCGLNCWFDVMRQPVVDMASRPTGSDERARGHVGGGGGGAAERRGPGPCAAGVRVRRVAGNGAAGVEGRGSMAP